MHVLPDGVELELVHHAAAAQSSGGGVSYPPLLFIHGAGHAAWCWKVPCLPAPHALHGCGRALMT